MRNEMRQTLPCRLSLVNLPALRWLIRSAKPPLMIKSLSEPHPLRYEAAGSFLVGTWLSLVEHSLGVRGVGSSNLPVPTISVFSFGFRCLLPSLD